MISEKSLLDASNAFFNAFAASKPPTNMLGYFSISTPVVLQHAPAGCPQTPMSRHVGSNAIRSYLDLLATHWIRSDVCLRNPPQADEVTRRVVLPGSATWSWRKSGRKWTEDFIWTLDFDEGLKIISFVVQTVSEPSTCVMRATDIEPTDIVQSPLPLLASM